MLMNCALSLGERQKKKKKYTLKFRKTKHWPRAFFSVPVCRVLSWLLPSFICTFINDVHGFGEKNCIISDMYIL